MYNVRIKICCISSIQEARMAIGMGADALGLVARMPSGPGIISDEQIRQIAHSVPPAVSTFLLTSETDAQGIVGHYKRVHTTTIQIVDELKEKQYDLIRLHLPHVKLVQVIHVTNEKSVEEAIELSEYVDALLLDSGNPHLEIKELGGTGRVHDWKLSRKIRDSIKVPVFLAGGLNKDNVRNAIDAVQPFGVDICSGVRTNGKLDKQKLEAFFEAARGK